MSMVPPTGGEKPSGFRYNEKLKTGEPMPEVTLRSIVEEEIRTSIGFVGGDISESRRRAMDYYLGDPFGNEQEDRSAVVSTDVQDTIESVMPEMMEIFAGGDEIVRYDPHGPEDEPFAEQATDYVNYIWNNDNDGFDITHDWVKDGLLQKNGIIKIFWDDFEESKRETIERINSLAMQELLGDDEVEIVAHEEYTVDDPVVLPFAPDGILHDVELIRTREDGRIHVVPVPPEEFLIARRSVSLNDDDFAFAAHKTRKTASDLLAMGFPMEVINNIPSHDDQDYNEERISRFDDDEWPELDDSLDPSMREIWLYECYLKTDFDGDGIAEMRKVTVAGPGYDVLINEPIDEHPFASLTPIKMPHKFFGRSVADLVMDIQLIKSTIQRQLLDNMYQVNNARTGISNKVDIDDYLTNRPGGAVRVDIDTPEVGGHMIPLQTQSLGPYAMPLLEYWDSIREMRTGVTRLGQGLDPDALNTTARGMNMMLGRTQRRMLLMARTMAEGGFRPAFKKILKLVVNHQDRPRTIRLRNKWVEMDPRSWNSAMDVTVSVGLGHGTKESQAMMLERLLEKQITAIQFQGGAQGPLVNLEKVHNTLKKWVHSIGQKDADSFFMDPEGQPMPKSKPDPKMIEMQAKSQEAQLKLQFEDKKLQIETALKKEDQKLAWAKLEMEHNVDIEKVGVEKDKVAVGLIAKDAEIREKEDQRESDERSRENDDQNGAVSEVVKGLSKSAEILAKAESGGSLKDASKGLSELAKAMSQPKKVVRDKKGNITGVEPA